MPKDIVGMSYRDMCEYNAHSAHRAESGKPRMSSKEMIAAVYSQEDQGSGVSDPELTSAEKAALLAGGQ